MPLDERDSASTAPMVKSPPRGCVSTSCTSPAIGPATTCGHDSKISRVASLARSEVPRKPASAVMKMKNGNIEVSIDSAIWLAIGQPSSIRKPPMASKNTPAVSFMPYLSHAARPRFTRNFPRQKCGLRPSLSSRMLRRRNDRSAALDVDDLAAQAQRAMDALLARATAAVRQRVAIDGRLDAARIEAEQHAVHGLAWLATYAEAVRQLAAYAQRMQAEGRFGDTEALLTRIGLGEYLAQTFGGIPMNQGEFVRLADFGLDEEVVATLRAGPVAELI